MSHKGPLTLLDGKASDEDLKLASQIVARFSQGRDAEAVDVEVTEKGVSQSYTVTPLKPDEIEPSWRV